MITYLQALILGLVQGITELFPISSLGHSVLIAWLLNWHSILASESRSESFFLSFLVILHVATATALLVFYRHTWLRIIKGFFSSVQTRQVDNPDSRLAWLLIVATIPAGIIGLAFEHILRTQFAKPLSAIIFLLINGCILLVGDRYQRNHQPKRQRTQSLRNTTEQVSAKLTFGRAVLIGVAQIGALCAGISRSGITMVSGMYSGLETEDAARFSFLLATPIIFGAGLVKLPDFFSHLDAGVRGQILVGGIGAAIAAYVAVRYLDKYFQNKSLRPFGMYCICASLALLALGLVRGHF
ncbi:MAG TPA: undecaprenyl-diphosphate phosphatase [Verrucomicrobiae bacterium]|jgi:undecaprenyl-diphosphatase|nr:undecaprenyl-diphosphate phosphatase [Verrucomicrobiae bacterium]